MRSLAYAENALWAAGVVCMGVCLLLTMPARDYRSSAEPLPQTHVTTHQASSDQAIGRLDIPALALSVPILPDYEAASLRHGVGHIPGTAVPGGLGTVGLAGHRDTYFRPLRRITPRMDIQLTDSTGTYHYVVDSTEIVSPDKTQVLDIASRPELTLITCFPFDYVGAAPRRFIVHAHLLSASPDAASVAR